eukprot:c28787_g1_i16 orf=1756-1995(+)
MVSHRSLQLPLFLGPVVAKIVQHCVSKTLLLDNARDLTWIYSLYILFVLRSFFFFDVVADGMISCLIRFVRRVCQGWKS